MQGRSLLHAILVVALLAVAILACGPAAPTPQPTEPPPSPLAKSPCGDGVCDEVEQRDPSLCPQDCPVTAEPTEEPTETPAPLPTEEPTQTPAPLPTDTALPEPTVTVDKCGDGVCDETEAKDPALCPEDCATPEAPVTVEVTEAPPTAPTATPTEVIASPASVTTISGEYAVVGDPTTIDQEGAEASEPPQSNVALILDGSGSMGEELPGSGQAKLAVAKNVMAELIPQIPAELNSTLWIYAHRYPPDPKAESCKDIEQVFPLGPVDADAYLQAIQGIQANGWTPIADSIVAAADKLPAGDFNSMILVSDGEETCGGDPCAVAEALKESNTELTVHVVGYAVDDATRKQLECIASVSGGSYHDATDAEGLLLALQEALAATVVETVLRVEVDDPEGTQVNVPVHLYEAGTDRLVSDYSVGKDNVVPPGNYTLQVDTLPKILYQDLALPEGSTTVVRIVLSAIRVLTPDGREDTMVDLLDTTGERLDFRYAGTIALVPGTYQVRVRNSVSQPITLGAGELFELRLGAIRVLTPDGREDTMVDILDTSGQRLDFGYAGLIELVPGTYQLRVNDTLSQPITLGAGDSMEFRLGVIQVAGSFELTDAEGNRLGLSRQDSALIAPGTYTVKLADGAVIEDVVVEAGQVTEVR